MNTAINRLSIVTAVVMMMFTPQVVLALAPADPFFFLQFNPKMGNIAAGSSGTFALEALSQEGYEGNVILALENPPSGITASFDTSPIFVPGYGSGISTVTINVASNVPEGSIELSVLGTDEAGEAKSRSTKVTITVTGGGGGSVPASGSVPSGEVITTTVTTTVTTTTSVISTVTQVITTKTSEIATKTSVDEFDQVSDLIYPLVTIVIVIIFIAVAVIMMRKPKS